MLVSLVLNLEHLSAHSQRTLMLSHTWSSGYFLNESLVLHLVCLSIWFSWFKRSKTKKERIIKRKSTILCKSYIKHYFFFLIDGPGICTHLFFLPSHEIAQSYQKEFRWEIFPRLFFIIIICNKQKRALKFCIENSADRSYNATNLHLSNILQLYIHV